MFLVFNREKINSYLISLGTVVVLFVIAFLMTNNTVSETSAKLNDTPESNISINEIKKEQNQIYE